MKGPRATSTPRAMTDQGRDCQDSRRPTQVGLGDRRNPQTADRRRRKLKPTVINVMHRTALQRNLPDHLDAHAPSLPNLLPSTRTSVDPVVPSFNGVGLATHKLSARFFCPVRLRRMSGSPVDTRPVPAVTCKRDGAANF